MAGSTGDDTSSPTPPPMPPPPAPPGFDHSAKFLVPASLLYTVSLALTMARVYSRVTSRVGLKWNDHTLLLANGLGTAWFGIVAHLYKLGRGVENHPDDLVAIGPWLVTAGLLWIWTTNLIRMSMGLMLLRLKEERRWTWPLRSLVLAQVCLMAAATTVQLLVCRPLSGVWNPSPDMKCIPMSGMVKYGIVYNVVNIMSDLILALMPLSFIPKMNRPVIERAVLFFLMLAGLGATVTAVVRAVTLLGFYGEYPVAWLNIKTDLLTSIETYLGVIAANLPCLKAPTHRLLIRIGLLRHSRASDVSFSGFLYGLSRRKHFQRQPYGLGDPEWQFDGSLYPSSGDSLQASEPAAITAPRRQVQ